MLTTKKRGNIARVGRRLLISSKLEARIKNKKAQVAVIGLGYVGLPLACEIARAGFSTFGYEVDKSRVKLINSGKSYIDDIDSLDLTKLVKNKQLVATSDSQVLTTADIIIICVPTPLTPNKIPDMHYIEDAAYLVSKNLRKGQLVILESTTYPGTTEEVVKPLLEKSSLKAGRDFFLAFSPERVDPGNKQYKIKDIPKVVGGINQKSTELAQKFYESFTPRVFTVSSPRVAEMSKLLENVFRLVNISLVNELALLCDRLQIDIWEVIEAAKTKPYGFMAFYPGPAAGGHCTPLDPFYLSYKAKEHGFFTRFIELAGEINELMPHFVVTKVIWALNQKQVALNGAKILVLGVTYKKDISDTRESAALKIMEDLFRKKAELSYHDPYVQELTVGEHVFKSTPLNRETLKKADCVLILTDHSNFAYKSMVKYARLIVDTRNAIKDRSYKQVVRL